MLDFTLLTQQQIFGDKKLDILKQYGIRCPISDYAILLGGIVDYSEYINGANEVISRTGSYWTKNTIIGNRVLTVDTDGGELYEEVVDRMTGARLVVPYSSIKYLSGDFKDINGIKIKEYGEYPQTAVSEELSSLLEKFYNEGKLNATGKLYTSDSVYVGYDDRWIGFKSRQCIEYEYMGEKYVRFKGNINASYEILSNRHTVKLGDVIWIKVEPIEWLIDEKYDIALSKNILFAGVQFNRKKDDIINFEESDIKKFIDEYFAKEIMPVNVKVEQVSYNPYNFDFSEVTEEEIIKGCVESNIAVMLHGRSGDGKSARVKELDPDVEILYLINASPDSLGGKSIVYNGEMIDIPPTWYTKLKEKCESEPDKIHIVFFDEITNAPPSIQGMAFNIILDKEVNGKWKLPDNARIVAAGNELEESRSAYGISEPLFNRFAHVYIETKVEDWLKWASTPSETYERLDYKEENVPMKIHPSIYAFIAYKSFKGEDVLRSKFDGIKPNADPRKWELASKVLYETRKPEMLRSLVGEEITREFTMFCRQRVITIEDVLSGNYTEEDLRMDTGEKYNTAVGLSAVTMEHFEKVREFVKRLGPEICATYETLWAHGIEERLEKIQEIKLSERTK